MEVYIILTDTGTIFTNLIKVFTSQPLNHASISFTKELDQTYSFGRKHANNPFIGGFVKENMMGSLFKNASCAIYKCSVLESEYDKMVQAVKQIETNRNDYKYNFIGLFGVLLNKGVDRKNAFFCSQFVATILKSGGITIKGKPTSLVKPSDFISCERMSLKYEGRISDYLSQVLVQGGGSCAAWGTVLLPHSVQEYEVQEFPSFSKKFFPTRIFS